MLRFALAPSKISTYVGFQFYLEMVAKNINSRPQNLELNQNIQPLNFQI